MTFKTIMVQLDVDDFSRSRVKLAADLAKRFSAKLIGIAACDVRPPMATDGVVVNGELLDQERAEIEARLAQMRDQFRGLAGDAEWRGYVGVPRWLAALNARSADLIVCGSPHGAAGGDFYRSVDLGELVLSAGRPVLVAAKDAESVAAEKVLVAWNDSREARRALFDALPLLTGAKDVLVATVDDPDSAGVQTSVADVVDYLGRHGIAGRSEIVSSAGGRAGERLVDLAKGMGADLLVSGAYGHSRLREWVFGGVTRTLFDSGTISRLMSN